MNDEMPPVRPSMLQAVNGDVGLGVWLEIGPHFTCSEADAVLTVLVACGFDLAAVELMKGHVASDEDDSDFETHRELRHALEVIEATGDWTDGDGYDPFAEVVDEHITTIILSGGQ